ncbi:MAG TPA: type II secretion system protein GspD [Desulfofustis sp.]|nr:type II secretion system protein GspD [Desulfofustis sp.]
MIFSPPSTRPRPIVWISPPWTSLTRTTGDGRGSRLIPRCYKKKHSDPMKKRFTLFICCLLSFLASNHSVLAQSPEFTDGVDQPSDERYITIDFDNVDIQLFIKYISELTGTNFIVDPSVQGNVTIVSPTRISERDAYRVFESVLEVHGLTTVKAGSVVKVIPTVEARSRPIDTLIGEAGIQPDDRVVTQLIPLSYTSPLEMQKVLQPLVSKTSVMIAHTQSGMLIITDTLSNIDRLLEIVRMLDVERTREEIEVILLEYANSQKISQVITSIYQKSLRPQAQGGAASQEMFAVVPYERINALIIMALPEDSMRIKELIAQLDTEAQRGEGNIHVYYLQNATAAELSKVLTALPKQQETAVEEGKVPAISSDVTIMPDAETNALIITASRTEYAVLREVIEKLDIPRRMVYLEALIMEVNMDKSLDIGVEWLAGGTFDDGTGQIATGFSGDPPYGVLSGIRSDPPSLPTGYTLGILKQGIQIGGVTFPNIAAVLRAYESDSTINIISTPQILTTDNKEAEITVGENVPFLVSENTTDALQDYSNYEYRDVATTLSITPHISQADTLRLEISTEVSKLKSAPEIRTPTTFTRRASTSVIVNDRDTVVIGGIIGQDVTDNEFKIPLLGDIPLLGWLFKTKGTSDQRTNMFIFITPHIVRNPAEIARVTLEKEDQLGNVMPQVEKELRRPENPDNAIVLADIGYEKLRDGNYTEAKAYLSQALAITPDDPYALINLGVAHEKEGNYQAARQFYQQVVETGTDQSVLGPDRTTQTTIPLLQIASENIRNVDQLMRQGEASGAGSRP